jgi:hypothetical protein
MGESGVQAPNARAWTQKRRTLGRDAMLPIPGLTLFISVVRYRLTPWQSDIMLLMWSKKGYSKLGRNIPAKLSAG